MALVHSAKGGLIGKSEPLLHDVHAASVLDCDWRPAPLAMRAERLHSLDKQDPNRRRFDLLQKALPIRPLLLLGKFQLGEAPLVYPLAPEFHGHEYPGAYPRHKHETRRCRLELNHRL